MVKDLVLKILISWRDLLESGQTDYVNTDQLVIYLHNE